MHSIDIDVQDENIAVVFEVPGVHEEDVTIDAEGDTLRVVTSRNKAADNSKDGNIDISVDSVYYNKTAVLPEKADMKNMRATFFAGLLEIIIPRIK
ncbi:MAG: Hsp20/alpha crystallin family protein [Candidatus Aenigmatarchaeota archaeon]